MLDHVGVPVSDFERSKRYYAQALSPLGYELIMEPSASAAGFGRRGKPDFWIAQGEIGQAFHIAFAADDRATVDAFYEVAIAAGATTVVPDFAPSTMRATTVPSSTTRTATTSKRSAISQQKKSEGGLGNPRDPLRDEARADDRYAAARTRVANERPITGHPAAPKLIARKRTVRRFGAPVP